MSETDFDCVFDARFYVNGRLYIHQKTCIHHTYEQYCMVAYVCSYHLCTYSFRGQYFFLFSVDSLILSAYCMFND